MVLVFKELDEGKTWRKTQDSYLFVAQETLDFPPETILWQLQKTQLRSVPFSWVVTKDLPTMEKHVQLFPSDSMVEVFSHLFVA